MNKNDQDFIVQKIRAQYTENETKENKELDELKELDKEVKRPASTFAYTFGTIGALIMGVGMSISMTNIGSRLENAMAVGVAIGVVGLVMVVINYPIYNKILKSRRDKYADQIIALSNKIMGEE